MFWYSPLSAYWDVEPQYPYVCVNIGMFTLVCGILNILTDFLCLFLPVPMIWNIQRPKKQRIAILAMFAVGALTCVAGIARTIYADITLRKTYDMTWWLYPLHLATALEIDVGLVSLIAPFLSNTRSSRKIEPVVETHIFRSAHLSRRSEPYFFITRLKINDKIRLSKLAYLGSVLSRIARSE